MDYKITNLCDFFSHRPLWKLFLNKIWCRGNYFQTEFGVTKTVCCVNWIAEGRGGEMRRKSEKERNRQERERERGIYVGALYIICFGLG